MAFWHFHWNFYRIHLTFFILHPLIWSAIFWGVNGKYPVSYTNSLFLCFSAQTVTGLSPLNLSTLTGFQQAILFWLMVTGDATVVSWVMVMVRRYYFIRKCAYVIRRKREQSKSKFKSAIQVIRSRTTGHTPRYGGPEQPLTPATQPHLTPPTQPRSTASTGAGFNVITPSNVAIIMNPPTKADSLGLNFTSSPAADEITNTPFGEPLQRTQSPSALSNASRAINDSSNSADPVHALSSPSAGAPGPTPRSVGFAPQPTHSIYTPSTAARTGAGFPRTTTNLTNRSNRTSRSWQTRSAGLAGTASNAGVPSNPPLSPREYTSQQGFGGFPTPLTLGARLAKKVAPAAYRALERKLTIIPEARQVPLTPLPLEKAHISGPLPHRRPTAPPGNPTHVPERTDTSDWTDDLEALGEKMKSYVKQTAIWVGRNSFFHLEDLSDEELEEVGGVEFGAIRVLSWLVPAYIIGTNLICFIVWVSYLSSVHRYDTVFEAQPRRVPVSWYSAFQAVSAFTGGGLSLVDMGMVPFISASTLVVFLGFLIIGGNMLMPVFLRGVVWVIYRLLPAKSQDRPYFRFLLDHPRRCFLYLFPSHQTWFLVAVFFFLTAVEWGGFLLLNIGLDAYSAMPTGQRVLAGWFQSLGVRASGFSIVSLGALAPACKLLYIVMMYISAYPIAMSLRSTNVYEERSLGVYGEEDKQDESEPQGEVFSKYLGWHVRRQLAFDLWWLAAALLLINVIERSNLMSPDNEGWFNQFSLLFEIVSAYATVGLSLGIPTENYSLSGSLRTGSKIVLILVMIRGRHRDLPVAIDRAILLPEEFSKATADPSGRHIVANDVAQQLEEEASRMSSSTPPASPRPQSPSAHMHQHLPGNSTL